MPSPANQGPAHVRRELLVKAVPCPRRPSGAAKPMGGVPGAVLLPEGCCPMKRGSGAATRGGLPAALSPSILVSEGPSPRPRQAMAPA